MTQPPSPAKHAVLTARIANAFMLLSLEFGCVHDRICRVAARSDASQSVVARRIAAIWRCTCVTELVGHGRHKGNRNRAWDPAATYLVFALASCLVLRKFVTLSLVSALTQDARDFFSRSAKIQWTLIVYVHGLSYAPALLILGRSELEDGLRGARRSDPGRSHPNLSRVNLPRPCR